MRRGPDRIVYATWWRQPYFDEQGKLTPRETFEFYCHARFIPELIIDGKGEEVRTHGHLFMQPGREWGGPQDHVLRSIWPVPGEWLKIKERMYQILAVHRIVDGGQWGHAYRVDLR